MTEVKEARIDGVAEILSTPPDERKVTRSAPIPLSLAYDLTRLATRAINDAPNGIDRIDLALAQYFTNPLRGAGMGIITNLLGPRAISASRAGNIIGRLRHRWGEDQGSHDGDPIYRKVVAWLRRPERDPSAAERIAKNPRLKVAVASQVGVQLATPSGRNLIHTIPKNAIYLNASQFPLWVSPYFSGLRRRPDIRLVFFIHDLLPIEVPEYFRKSEYERHLARLKNVAAFATAAIVATQATRTALRRHMASLGRDDIPILAAPMPAASVFSRRDVPDPDLAGNKYFVVCGTLEPRKNHLMLLQIWRELVCREGASAPKLIIIGKRGWQNENVTDFLERCEIIRNHVLEVNGLSTPGFKKLLDGCLALLMPSFAEGYGLPVVEALAAGTPVIASDIDVFREIGGSKIKLVSPIDGPGWLSSIRSLIKTRSGCQRLSLIGCESASADWPNYFETIEGFLASL